MSRILALACLLLLSVLLMAQTSLWPAANVEVDHTPQNYTQTAAPRLEGHLAGIDNALTGGGGGEGIFNVDVDGDGIFDCRDTDGDQLCEQARMWDADGDGSEFVTTCTAKDDPFPQCWYAGMKIRVDLNDDANCMLLNFDGTKRCGATYALERDAVLFLQPGVGQVNFPCWDVGEWLAADETPGAPPADTSINDPRDETRRDERSDLTYADCPVDHAGWGIYPINFSTNSITLTCENHVGMPVRDARRTRDITSGEFVGCVILNDMGRNSVASPDRWYDVSNVRMMQAAPNVFSSGTDCRDNAQAPAVCGTAAAGAFLNAPANGSSWGHITDVLSGGTAGANADNIVLDLCVCNAEGCGTWLGGTAPARASANNWVSSLRIGDTVLIDTPTSDGDADTRQQYWRGRVDEVGSSMTQGNCPADNVRLKLGGMKRLDGGDVLAYPGSGNERAQTGVPYAQGEFNCNGKNTECMVVKVAPGVPDNYGLKVRNITYMPVDGWENPQGDCNPTNLTDWPWSISLGPDDDRCDSIGFTDLRVGGHHFYENVTFVEQGSDYMLDGSGNLYEIRLVNLHSYYGNGAAVVDPGTNWTIRGMRIFDSFFGGAMFSAIGVSLDWRDIYVENTSALNMMQFEYQRFLDISKVRVVNSRFSGEEVVIGCGVQNSSFRDFSFVSGGGDYNRGSGRLGFNCTAATTLATRVTGNIFERWTQNTPENAGLYMVRFAQNVPATVNFGNHFTNFSNMARVTGVNEPCTFVVEQTTQEDIFEKNSFSNITQYYGTRAFGRKNLTSSLQCDFALDAGITEKAINVWVGDETTGGFTH